MNADLFSSLTMTALNGRGEQINVSRFSLTGIKSYDEMQHDSRTLGRAANKCEHCGKQLKFVFRIRDRETSEDFEVGEDCMRTARVHESSCYDFERNIKAAKASVRKAIKEEGAA